MKGTSTTYEEVAKYLESQGERYMAVMVRDQTRQLLDCRQENLRTLQAYYELRNRHEPPRHHVHPGYRSPPESDG